MMLLQPCQARADQCTYIIRIMAKSVLYNLDVLDIPYSYRHFSGFGSGIVQHHARWADIQKLLAQTFHLPIASIIHTADGWNGCMQ